MACRVLHGMGSMPIAQGHGQGVFVPAQPGKKTALQGIEGLVARRFL